MSITGCSKIAATIFSSPPQFGQCSRNTVADYAPRPAWRPLTKFENRGLQLGHGVWDVVFTRPPFA